MAYVLLKSVQKRTVTLQHKDSVERSHYIYLPQPFVCSHVVGNKKECLEDGNREIHKISFCSIQPFPEKNI